MKNLNKGLIFKIIAMLGLLAACGCLFDVTNPNGVKRKSETLDDLPRYLQALRATDGYHPFIFIEQVSTGKKIVAAKRDGKLILYSGHNYHPEDAVTKKLRKLSKNFKLKLDDEAMKFQDHQLYWELSGKSDSEILDLIKLIFQKGFDHDLSKRVKLSHNDLGKIAK